MGSICVGPVVIDGYAIIRQAVRSDRGRYLLKASRTGEPHSESADHFEERGRAGHAVSTERRHSLFRFAAVEGVGEDP